MNPWLYDLARLWGGGQEDTCAVHPSHDTIMVQTTQFGEVCVFDWEKYANTEGYCTGDDDLSKSLAINHAWETPGTRLVTELLDAGDPNDPRVPQVVLDFGSHIGWYTYLAAKCGYDVLAIDADPEHITVLLANAWRMEISDHITVCRGWINDDVPTCSMPNDRTRIRFVKADIEGNEDSVVRILDPMLQARRIDALMLEISPVFSDHYPDTVMHIADCGYDVAVVPGAPDEPLEPIPYDAIRDYVASIQQLDFWFTLQEKTA